MQFPEQQVPRDLVRGPRRQTSGLAVAALVAPLATPISMFFIVRLLYVFAWEEDTTSLGRVLPGLVYLSGTLALGVAAVIRVFASRGRLAGRAYAITGSLLSAFGLYLTFTVFYSAAAAANKALCLCNIKQVALAVTMYEADHNGALPPADAWSDKLFPRYIMEKDLFTCPEAPNLKSGYAFNRALAGVRLAKIAHPERTVLLYESDLGWNGAGGPETLVKKPRHWGQDVFAFADGSCRALKRGEESGLAW